MVDSAIDATAVLANRSRCIPRKRRRSYSTSLTSGGNIFTGNQVKFLIDKIVADIDPNVRAGCAAALGCIHSNVGGMAAGLHLKTILGILLSQLLRHLQINSRWIATNDNRTGNNCSNCLEDEAGKITSDTKNNIPAAMR